MDYSNVPSYPPSLLSKDSIGRLESNSRLTPHQVRRLIDLSWLVGIIVILLWTGREANRFRQPLDPPPVPLPFQLLAERASRIRSEMSASEVFGLLGPEQFVKFREPEMDEFDRSRFARPDRYPDPSVCYWSKWADPADPARWIAIFICGGHVYKTYKRGL
jgi:hypothetical protein